jgi:hypothetical protein
MDAERTGRLRVLLGLAVLLFLAVGDVREAFSADVVDAGTVRLRVVDFVRLDSGTRVPIGSFLSSAVETIKAKGVFVVVVLAVEKLGGKAGSAPTHKAAVLIVDTRRLPALASGPRFDKEATVFFKEDAEFSPGEWALLFDVPPTPARYQLAVGTSKTIQLAAPTPRVGGR